MSEEEQHEVEESIGPVIGQIEWLDLTVNDASTGKEFLFVGGWLEIRRCRHGQLQRLQHSHPRRAEIPSPVSAMPVVPMLICQANGSFMCALLRCKKAPTLVSV